MLILSYTHATLRAGSNNVVNCSMFHDRLDNEYLNDGQVLFILRAISPSELAVVEPDQILCLLYHWSYLEK